MELKAYLQPLRRWWWLVAATALVATLASIIVTRNQPYMYESRATLMVGRAINDPNPNSNDYSLTLKLANTYADLARRSPVRAAVMAAQGLTELPEYNVRVVPDTQLVEMKVLDADPRRAQAVADELARQLMAQTQTGAQSEATQRQVFIAGQLDQLEAGLQQTKAEIERKQGELAALLDPEQITEVQTQLRALENKQAALQGNYADLLASTERGAVNSLNIVEPATLPTLPVGPNKPLTIFLAAAMGLLVGVGAAFLLESLDDTLKNPEDVRAALQLTTLGAVPAIEMAAGEGELVGLSPAQSPAKESYRVLRTNLQFASVDEPLRCLMVTSPAPSEGKSMTAANLAIALAQAGQQVILMDADLHRPRQHRLFKVANNTGLTTGLLVAHPDPAELLKETAVSGLRLLTSGPLPPNSAELLGSHRMAELLAALQTQADIVVVDSPPATVLSDAAILSTQVDGVLLVLVSGQTRRELAQRAVDALKHVNARLVGVVLNRMPVRGSSYYYYYNHEGYDDAEQKNGIGSRLRRRKRSGAPAPVPALRREG
jgi:non-specific protein-tyrosine kinase